MNNKNYKKGISLIELIIYIGIVGIILVVMIDLATNLVYSQSKNASFSEVQQNLRFTLERMSTSIENATAVTGSFPSNTLNLTVGGNQIIYRLNGSVLEIEESGSTYNLSSSKVIVSAPTGNLFDKITNEDDICIKISIMATLESDQNISQEGQTSVLLRTK